MLLPHYNDVTKDHDGLIKKPVDFLGVKLTSEEFSKISEKCTLKYMKQNAKSLVPPPPEHGLPA